MPAGIPVTLRIELRIETEGSCCTLVASWDRFPSAEAGFTSELLGYGDADIEWDFYAEDIVDPLSAIIGRLSRRPAYLPADTTFIQA